MGIDINQYRESIGRHYFASITVKKSKRLNRFDIFCAYLFMYYGSRALPLTLIVFITGHPSPSSIAKEETSYREDSTIGAESTVFSLDIRAYLFFVLCLLLIISGIEINPGPLPSDSSSSLSSASSISSSISNLMTTSFSFLQLNIQSIIPKLDMVVAEYSCHDILSFTESWLKPDITTDSLKIPGYKAPFRRDRIDRMGGGVIVYVKDDINCVTRNDLQVGNVECIWLEVKLRNKKYLYGTFYIPPNSSQQVWDDFEHSLDLALNSNCDVIITGDFNVNQLSNNTAKIDNILIQFSLHQLITEPTYMTEHSSSLLDLLLVSNPHCVMYAEVGPPLLDQIRYHMPTIGILNHPRKPQTSLKRKVYLYSRGDYESYRQQLSAVDWDALFVDDDIDNIVSNITREVIQSADANIPNRIITVRKDNPPWLTSNIKKCIRRKNRLHRRAKRSNIPGHWAQFRLARNKCNKLITNAKASYYSSISEKMNSEKSGSKNWWNLVKRLVGNSDNSRSIPPIEFDGELVFNDITKSDLFNDFFCAQTQLDDTQHSPPDIPNIQTDGLEQIVITENEVEDMLKILDTTKATGADMINPRFLKEASSILKYPLCKLFNLSLTSCCFPSEWKAANVTPIFKKDSPSNLKNYRPISLLSVVGKVMERCVYKHIYNYLLENGITSSNQSGFTPGDSAVNQLLYITNEFGNALDKGKEIRVIFCDISKAFDRVWHRGLLRKLRSIGINGQLLTWIDSYLSNRKQRVVINGCTSDWENIHAGVPQGSILGPLLFIIYINDIVADINSSIKLFADDTSLYLIVDDPLDTAETLNGDLTKIHDWSMKWLVKFNPQKTETLKISRKTNRPFHPPLVMDNNIISSVTEHKHLGLTISDDGTWGKHIDMISKKAYTRVNILRKFKFILDRKTLEKIYMSFIRPLLEYGDVIWDNKSVSLINKLESIQTEAARIVTGGTRLVSINKLYTETGWERLSERREQHRLVYFFKMSKGLTPQYLSNLVPINLRSIHDHNTRHSAIIPPVRTRTSLYSNYFLPQTVRSWNLLPETVKNCTSLSSFKSHLRTRFIKHPFHYYVGSRLGQIFHARLRMECSSLNSHLYQKNIVDSPSCVCGSIETSEHFLFHCPRYNISRQRYINSLHLPIQLNLDILLLGSNELTAHLNSEIFLTVQKFILSSKRFTS